MKKIIYIFLICISCISNISFALSEQEQCEFNGINYAQAKSFVVHIKAALDKNDKNKVADLISYPLRINKSPSKHYTITSKHTFMIQYPKLFPEKARKSILEDKGIFCNYQGAMLGGGAIWFNTKNNSIKIFSINLN